jgi:hypothetical protein
MIAPMSGCSLSIVRGISMTMAKGASFNSPEASVSAILHGRQLHSVLPSAITGETHLRRSKRG